MTPRLRKVLWLAIRLAVCVGLLWVVFRKFDWGAARRIALEMNVGGALLALLVFAPAPLLQSVRFVWMLRLQDIHISYWIGIKLCFAGNLLNYFVPGSVGGDIYKAYYVTKHTSLKTEAVTTLFLDRIVGLVSLVALAAAVTLINYRDPLIGQLRLIGELKLGPSLLLGLGAMAAGAALYFSPLLRRVSRLGRIVDRLPIRVMLRRADAAVHNMRHRFSGLLACFGITLVLQLASIVSAYLGARALGLETHSFIPYLVYIAVGFLVWAVPISFGGLGTMDAYYQWVIVGAGLGSAEKAIFLAMFVRLTQLLWALPGVLVPLTGAHLPSAEAVARLRESTAAGV